jgi:hypothetical protein
MEQRKFALKGESPKIDATKDADFILNVQIALVDILVKKNLLTSAQAEQIIAKL